MAFADDKAAALPYLQALNCEIADIVDTSLTGYNDLAYVLAFLLRQIGCYVSIIEQFTAAFDQAERESRGIYYDVAGPFTDPKIVIKCTTTSISYTTTSPATVDQVNYLYIGGTSVIDEVAVDGGYALSILHIAPGSRVKLLEASGAGTTVSLVEVAGCAGAVATLDVVDKAASVGFISVYGGGWFGGYNCLEPDGVCAEEVTVLAASQATYNSILLSWTAAAESIRTRVYYRINNDVDWKEAGLDNGDGVRGNYRTDGTLGYAFKGLQPDTYYDFKVVNICNNGIASTGETLAAQKTASYIPACP